MLCVISPLRILFLKRPNNVILNDYIFIYSAAFVLEYLIKYESKT